MKFEPQHLKGDILGGLTTGIVALPLALAFGVASGLEGGAQAGLYSAIFLGYAAAIFGGTKPQVSGPTGPMTVVAAGLVATAGNPKALFTAVMLGGVLQILFGILKLGHYIRYIPKPVISGFMTGIGVIIILIQLQPMFGLPNPSGPMQAIAKIPNLTDSFIPGAILLSVGTVALIYLTPYFSKQIPGALLALVTMTTISVVFGFDVPRIGELSTSLPSLSLYIPDSSDFAHVLLAALTLAILGSLDTLLGSVVVDQIINTKHDSDKELVGQGMGNMVGGLLGGLPGAGATMRTLLNIRSGGVTGLSGVVHSTILLGVLLGLGPLAAKIPLSVLAGILLTVGISIIDYTGLRQLPRAPMPDRLVLIIVLVLTVFVDLITAVETGFLVASLLFFQDLSNRELTKSGTLTSSVRTDTEAERLLADSIQVLQAEGPIVFGTSEAFITTIEESSPTTRAIIIRATRVPLIDQTGAFAIQEFVTKMKNRGISVVFSGLPSAPTEALRRLGVIPQTIREDDLFDTFAEAVEGLNKKLLTTEDQQLRPQPYLAKVGG